LHLCNQTFKTFSSIGAAPLTTCGSDATWYLPGDSVSGVGPWRTASG